MRLLLLFLVMSSGWLSAQETDTQPRYQVYYFLGEDCRICHYYAPEINALHEEFSSEEIGFVGLFPNRYSTEEGIQAYKDEYDIQILLKREYFGTKAKKFGITITPEVVIHDSHNDLLVYKGRIDDSYVRPGKRKRVISSHDLKEVLTDLKSGGERKPTETQAIGCYITFRK